MQPVPRLLIVSAAAVLACPVQAQQADKTIPHPIGNVGKWVTPADYPPTERNTGVTGVSSLTVTVDPEGRVTHCRITEGSGSETLDTIACDKVTERGRFDAAENEDGHPIAGEWSTRVVWTLAGSMAAPMPGYLVVSYTIETDGSVTDCTIERSEGAGVMTAQFLCANLSSFKPILDDHGEPVRKRVRTMSRVVHEPLP